MELSPEQKETFENLQKPTMELIGCFYKMPGNVESFFANMMAVYEANPTKETADALFDKVMGKESTDTKEKWMAAQASKLPLSIRKKAVKKYLTEKQPVPRGVPASGMVMTGLGLISRKEKDDLMEAQAAARLIAHVDVLHKYEPKTNYQNEDGSFENAFLDKPFATKMQRLEHLVNAVVNNIYTETEKDRNRYNEEKPDWDYSYPRWLGEDFTINETRRACSANVFLQKARNEALDTLARLGFESLAKALDTRENADEQLEFFKKVEAFYKKAPEANDRTSWATDGFECINKRIRTRLETAKEAKSPLTKADYDGLIEQTKKTPIAGLVQHRVGQILNDPSLRANEMVKRGPRS